MGAILAYWLAALAVAAFAFPFTARYLRRFPDAGAGLALAMGLLLVGHGYFLLRVFRVLPEGRGGVLAALALFAVCSVAFAARDRRFVSTAQRSLPGIIVAVCLLTVAFFAYATFRSYESGIGGTEQPMDFLFLNALLTSPEYPPQDPWLAGENVSYYYFGYLQSAFLTSLSGVTPSVGYNLSLAAVFASSAAAIASVCAALARWVLGRARGDLPLVAATAGVLLLLFAGTLSGVFELAAANDRYDEDIFRAAGLEGLLPCTPESTGDCYAGATPRSESWYPTEFWFWFRGSRVIPGTITEFPFFSFLLGDLHPHVMALPGTLLAVAVALALWRGRGVLAVESFRRDPLLALLLALVAGGLAFANTWDVLTFSLLLGMAVLARNLRAVRSWRSVADAALFMAVPAAAALVLFAPWWLDFSSQAGGFYAYVGEGTRPAHAFLQYGVVLVPALAALFALRRARALGTWFDAMFTAMLVPILPLLAWVLFAAARGETNTAINDRGADGWLTLALLVATTWLFSGATLALHQRRHAAAPALALATVGALLIFGSELLFVRDVFVGSVPRLNTVFKLTYQAWTLLSIAGAVGFAVALRAASERSLAAKVATPLVGLVLVASLVYALGAIPNRTGAFGNVSDIDGLGFLARSDADEYALTRWIAENTGRDDIVIEATGRRYGTSAEGPLLQDSGVDYTDAGRIAARTGRATPIGWFFHEIQWRGENPANRAEFTSRQDAVDAIYLSPTAEEALAGLRETGADWVVVGRLELQRYPAEHLADFAAFLDLAFQAGDLRIYRVPVNEAVPTS